MEKHYDTETLRNIFEKSVEYIDGKTCNLEKNIYNILALKLTKQNPDLKLNQSSLIIKQMLENDPQKIYEFLDSLYYMHMYEPYSVESEEEFKNFEVVGFNEYFSRNQNIITEKLSEYNEKTNDLGMIDFKYIYLKGYSTKALLGKLDGEFKNTDSLKSIMDSLNIGAMLLMKEKGVSNPRHVLIYLDMDQLDKIGMFDKLAEDLFSSEKIEKKVESNDRNM